MQHNRYSWRVFGICLVLTVLLLGVELVFADTGALNGEEKPLLFLVNSDLMPIAYLDNGEAKGVVVDIGKALGERIGRPVEIRAMDWVEAQLLVIAGRADGLIHMNRTPAREELYSFSEPLLQSEFVIFRRERDPFIQSVSDLEGKRVGVQAGGYGYDLIGKRKGVEPVFVSRAIQGLELLESGQIDALVIDRWLGEYALARTGIDGIQIAKEPLAKSNSHIAVVKGNDELLEQINLGLWEMEKDGTLTQIFDSWRGKRVIYVTREHIVKMVGISVTVVLLVISAVSIFFVVKLRRLNRSLEMRIAARTEELAVANERLRSVNEELEKLSVLDELTQIPNRRGFDSILEKAWGMSIRSKKPLSLIFVDLDRFKEVNDNHGHLTGDEYLKVVASTLQSVAQRSGDTVARLGGDEFACVMYETTEDGAAHVAEAMRERLEKLTISFDGGELKFPVSIGVASLIPEQGLDPAVLIALADTALYKAKETGRNQVVRASEL